MGYGEIPSADLPGRLSHRSFRTIHARIPRFVLPRPGWFNVMVTEGPPAPKESRHSPAKRAKPVRTQIRLL